MYKVCRGKEKTYIYGVLLGECTEKQLKEIYEEKGDRRFIEKVSPETKTEKPGTKK